MTYIDSNAVIYGKVKLGKNSSIWPQAVVRGDLNSISIGKNSNVQDNVTIHVNKENPVKIGEGVSLGHNAIIHGCTVKDNCLIGMGAIILNGAVIGENCIIGAGALVTEGKIIPKNSLVLGIPAKVIRELTKKEKKGITENAQEYVNLAKRYKRGSIL